MNEKIIRGIGKYYSDKIKDHGAGHLGVDWNSKESQYLRFRQLSNVIESENFSILDFGCGYGELVNFLNEDKTLSFDYFGYDIAEAMLEQARNTFREEKRATFGHIFPDEKFDYCIASGIFNVKLDLSDDKEWLSYIFDSLHKMNDVSNKGFSFNALTKYSDKSHMKDYLYYADPLLLFDYCIQNFSRNVALLHDYKLYEFSIIVRK